MIAITLKEDTKSVFAEKELKLTESALAYN